MEKAGCSSAKLATEEDVKVDQNEVGDDEAVNKELVGFQGDQSYSKQDTLVSGAAALAIFPEEVWEMILNGVEESEDVHSALLAFPDLDKAFQSKKAFWLFGAVLPDLMTKHLAATKYKELFKLRLVSKRWKSSVDSSLKSNVELEHLPPPCQKEDNQKLMPSANHFSYHRLDQRFGATVLHARQKLNEFLNAMCNHSGNPFPGGYLSILLKTSSFDKSLALFEKFGEHVLFLQIVLNGTRQSHLHLCQHLSECLLHTPNLRSLTFSGMQGASADENAGDDLCELEAKKLFPDLPNLEAFKWLVADRVPQTSRWIIQMIQKYAGKEGLGKLGTTAGINCPLPTSLLSLTELDILHLSKMTGLEMTEYAFNTLLNPHILRKFRLQTYNLVNMTKLLDFLAGYQVETLILVAGRLHEDPSSLIGMIHVPSIKAFHLLDVLGVSSEYDFFKRLPNLHFLTIHFKLIESWGWRDYFEEEIKPSDLVAKRIRGFVLKACDKNVEIKGNEEFSIWMELPQLKMLSVRVTQLSRIRNKEDSVWNVKFVRECGNKAFFGHCPGGNEVLHEDVQENGWWNEDDDTDSDDSEEFVDVFQE